MPPWYSLYAAAKSLQSCLTLCDPIDGSPAGSPIPGILQARTLSGLPFPSPMQVKLLSHIQLLVTPWTAAYQTSPSMGFSRQEHWSGLPFPSPGDLPNPGIEPRSPALEADASVHRKVSKRHAAGSEGPPKPRSGSWGTRRRGKRRDCLWRRSCRNPSLHVCEKINTGGLR